MHILKMRLPLLFNSLASKLRSIFLLQFQVLKTFKQFENDKQLVEVNLISTGCLFLYVNGKRIPKVNKVFVKPIDGNKYITFKAIGYFQVSTIDIEVEPVFKISSNLDKQISTIKDYPILCDINLGLKHSFSIKKDNQATIEPKNLESRLIHSYLFNKKPSLLKVNLGQPILKFNDYNLTEILTNHS
jgi:hypothetical protein